MNRVQRRLILGVFVVVVGGCGIQQTAEDTLTSVKDSNRKQDQMLEEMGVTTDGVHKQILTISLSQMVAPENTVILVPPARIFPFAKTFAEEATPTENLEVIHAMLKDLKKGTPDANANRLISFTVAGSIAAFIPEQILNAIIKDQIDAHGAYEGSTYNLLLLRYLFIKDYLFQSMVDSDILNMGCLEKASSYFELMKKIVALPYREKLTLSVPDMGLEGSISMADYQSTAADAKMRLEAGLTAEERNSAYAKKLLSVFDVR